MPKEIRYLLFSQDELLRAIGGLRRRRNQPLPRCALLAMALATEPEIGLSMVFSDSPDRPRETVQVDAAELGAALIHHCIEQRIPLPVQARKSLQVVDDELALVLSRGTEAPAASQLLACTRRASA